MINHAKYQTERDLRHAIEIAFRVKLKRFPIKNSTFFYLDK